MTTSEDGYVKWWDLRNLQQPTLQWRLQDINKQEGQVLSVIGAESSPQSDLVRTVELDHSPTVLEYEGTIPSRYMVGTSQGHILCCSRKAKTQKETILSKYTGAHYSSVRAVQRNTIFPKSFLSAGDWSIKVGVSLSQ